MTPWHLVLSVFLIMITAVIWTMFRLQNIKVEPIDASNTVVNHRVEAQSGFKARISNQFENFRKNGFRSIVRRETDTNAGKTLTTNVKSQETKEQHSSHNPQNQPKGNGNKKEKTRVRNRGSVMSKQGSANSLDCYLSLC